MPSISTNYDITKQGFKRRKSVCFGATYNVDENVVRPATQESQNSSIEIDIQTGKRIKTKRINANDLCQILKSRGLGDPRKRTKNHEVVGMVQRATTSTPSLSRSKSVMMASSTTKSRYSMEKLKGQARIQQGHANERANAFCEQMSGKQIRTVSANVRTRFPIPGRVGQFLSVTGYDGKDFEDVQHMPNDEEQESKEEIDEIDEEFRDRILQWISSCKSARQSK
ncbi:unnamed protein product [Owenia fusiformis]|uniref:Uncharacterized protein n=2 Tax=Owenia fusiformis TaxID=6347 RepID=A0A8J1T667_OWEFU|nr:unnamed protein product [Owenia fusiformis]